jgi:predicted nucleic acid-binding protein
MSADKTFLDTNVLVHAFDHDEPAKRERARDVLASAKPDTLAVSAQVLGEFYVTVTRKLARPLGEASAAEALEWLGLLHVVALDVPLVRAAVRVSRSAQLFYWDGLIVAAAEAAGCRLLLSEDLSDGQTIGTVRVENPFRER